MLCVVYFVWELVVCGDVVDFGCGLVVDIRLGFCAVIGDACAVVVVIDHFERIVRVDL